MSLDITSNQSQKLVRFLDQEVQNFIDNDQVITSDFFLFIIDKFFTREGNHICLETDNEF